MKYVKYTKESVVSYTFGLFPTFELLKHKLEQVECVITHSKLKTDSEDIKKLLNICKTNNISIFEDDKTINRLSDKENCFIVGVFRKYKSVSNCDKHIVLDNPSDMGNLGTIMRTMLGFGVTDLFVTTPCVDYFNPKVIRASMGAIFSLDVVELNNIYEYLNSSDKEKFLFMLNGKQNLGSFNTPKTNYALIFGNEARGLDKELVNAGKSVLIKHQNTIDSLNLPISVGMAIYEFNK